MRVDRDPGISAGFTYAEPLAELPLLTHCGEAASTAAHRIARHAHDGHELMYLARGSYAWDVGGRILAQEMGGLLVTLPGQAHGTAPAAHPPCQHLWLGVRLDALGAAGREAAAALAAAPAQLFPGCHEIEPLLRMVIAQVLSRRARRAVVVRRLLEAVAAWLVQRAAQEDAETEPVAELPLPYPLHKALHLMRSQLDRRVELADVARVAGCSPSRLCALFRQHLGASPVAHHLQLRLDAAREALAQPDAAILDVALAHGFSSSQHFSVAFREAYGTTPARYQAACAAGRGDGGGRR